MADSIERRVEFALDVVSARDGQARVRFSVRVNGTPVIADIRTLRDGCSETLNLSHTVRVQMPEVEPVFVHQDFGSPL